MTPETKKPTRAEALAELRPVLDDLEKYRADAITVERKVLLKIEAALSATDAPIVEGLGKDIEDRFSYMNQNDVKAIADYVVYRLYAQGRTQSAPDGHDEPCAKCGTKCSALSSNFSVIPICLWISGEFTTHCAKCVIDALSAAPPVTGGAWLPIESAPKDGTTFLAWHKDFDYGAGITRWSDTYDKFLVGDRPQPTHWQPLPAPPHTETERG